MRTLDIPDEKWTELLREREGVEGARGNGDIGPGCSVSEPGAPSRLPEDLNGILPELATATFPKCHLSLPASEDLNGILPELANAFISKMPFKSSDLDAI